MVALETLPHACIMYLDLREVLRAAFDTLARMTGKLGGGGAGPRRNACKCRSICQPKSDASRIVAAGVESCFGLCCEPSRMLLAELGSVGLCGALVVIRHRFHHVLKALRVLPALPAAALYNQQQSWPLHSQLPAPAGLCTAAAAFAAAGNRRA